MEYRIIRKDELTHYGIKGMKWGVRRYQNEDGTLTNAGKERYYSQEEQADLYEHAKASIAISPTFKTMTRGYTIRDVDDITEAGRFLKRQNELVTEHFNKYCDAIDKDLGNLRNNKKFMLEIKKKLDDDFGGPDQIDDEDFFEMVAYEHVDSTYGKYLSQSTRDSFSKFDEGVKQYYQNVKNIVDDIVGEYGNKPITSYTTSTTSGKGLFRKTINTDHDVVYKDAVENTLHELGQSAWIRHLNNHVEVALESDNYMKLMDAVKDEYMKSK